MQKNANVNLYKSRTWYHKPGKAKEREKNGNDSKKGASAEERILDPPGQKDNISSPKSNNNQGQLILGNFATFIILPDQVSFVSHSCGY